MALIIGLTGGISTGKNTVSTMFSTLHIPVIGADKVSREVVEPGKSGYHEIRRVVGQEVFKEDQTLKRKKLGAIIFADEEKRKQLNAIVHLAERNAIL